MIFRCLTRFFDHLLFTYSALSVTYLPPRGATVHALNRKSVKKLEVSRPVVLSVPGLSAVAAVYINIRLPRLLPAKYDAARPAAER